MREQQLEQLTRTITHHRSNKMTSEKQTETKVKNFSYGERIKHTSHPMAKQMLQVIEAKQSNLCVAADLLTCQEVLQLAEV